MNKALIRAEILRHQWAMKPGALEAIFAFVEDDIQLDAELFHNEQNKPAAYFGAAVEGALYSYKQGNVGVIVIDGPIIPRATWLSQVSGMVSIDVLTGEFKAMTADPDIEEVVLAMDTPGGAVTGISDFAAIVSASTKPVTAFTWDASSAGYWIASAADTIVAPLSGMVGSIGVVIEYADTTEKDEKSGIKHRQLVSRQSPNKRPDMDSDEGQAVVQQLLDDLASGFIETVATNRGVTVETVENSFGGGAVFAAPRAKEAGMIDAVEDFESFISGKTTKQPLTLQGFANVKGENMSEDNEILVAERKRIQGIESLVGTLTGMHPKVIEAAQTEINRLKYEPEETRESVGAALLPIINKAQVGVIESLKETKQEVTKAAEVTAPASTDENVDESAAESEARTVSLSSELGKIRGSK